MPIIYVSVADHGYGHSAQTAPVVNALRAMRPELELVIRSALPRGLLEAHFDGHFEHVDRRAEVGMCMDNALDVAAEASYRAHLDFHCTWEARVAREAAELQARGVALVFANVSYLMVAAAARAGIPAAVLCSLNWADIFHAYCDPYPEAGALKAQMLAAYNRAAVFLQPEPHMPMPGIRNALPVGPVARLARPRRTELDARLGLQPGQRLVLVAMGGIPMRLEAADWPRGEDIRYLVPAAWQARRPDMIPVEELDWPYLDLLCASDAVITKPGYGTFADCACNGVPALYVRRRDWPEEPHLIEWLQAHARCAEVPRRALDRGEFEGALRALWAAPAPPAPEATGVGEAAARLLKMLG